MESQSQSPLDRWIWFIELRVRSEVGLVPPHHSVEGILRHCQIRGLALHPRHHNAAGRTHRTVRILGRWSWGSTRDYYPRVD